MLKQSSSQEPLVQFQPNLAENMPGGWGFRFVQIRGWHLLGSNKGQNKEHFDKSSSHEPHTCWNTLIFTMEHPWVRRSKVVQIKSLGSCMSPLQGLKSLFSNI